MFSTKTKKRTIGDNMNEEFVALYKKEIYRDFVMRNLDDYYIELTDGCVEVGEAHLDCSSHGKAILPWAIYEMPNYQEAYLCIRRAACGITIERQILNRDEVEPYLDRHR